MKKKKLFENVIVIGIVTSVISTVIFSWFITPTTKWLFPKILKLINLFSAAFVDSFYRSATKLSAENANMSNLAFSFVSYIIIWSVFFLVTRTILTFYSQKLKRQIPSNALEDQQEIVDETVDEHLDIPIANQEKRLKLFKGLFSVILVLIIVHFVLSLYMMMSQIFSMNLCSNTMVNIEIVSPYISDQEYKQLKSDFYTIEGKQDYDVLHDKLELIAENNELTLKK